MSLAIVYLALMFLQQVPLPSSTPSVTYNVDFVFFIGLIGQALHHWPLTSPGSLRRPAALRVVRLSAYGGRDPGDAPGDPTVALRLDYVPTVVVLGCQLLALGRSFARSAWVGVLAIVAVFLLGPLDLTTNGGGAVRRELQLSSVGQLDDLFWLMFLLALIYLINERFDCKPGTPETMSEPGR